jgi:tryptophan-rich sensory protein
MMGLTWYVLGALSALTGYLMYEYSRKHPLNSIAWSGLVIGIASVLFSVAWGVGAVLEGVPRAASMGLLLFGLSGIIIVTVTARYISMKQDNSHSSKKA